MPNDSLILDETNRSKLDGIVQQMISNGEQDADINFVVEDFKSKYGVKKKVYGAFVPTPLNPTRGVSTSPSGSGDLVSSKNKANLLLRKQYETEGKEFSSYKKMSFDEYKSFVKKYNPNADLDNYENVKSLFIKSNDGLPLMMNAYSEVEEFDKSISGSEKMNFSQTPSEILAKETPKEAPKPSINKKKFDEYNRTYNEYRSANEKYTSKRDEVFEINSPTITSTEGLIRSFTEPNRTTESVLNQQLSLENDLKKRKSSFYNATKDLSSEIDTQLDLLAKENGGWDKFVKPLGIADVDKVRDAVDGFLEKNNIPTDSPVAYKLRNQMKAKAEFKKIEPEIDVKFETEYRKKYGLSPDEDIQKEYGLKAGEVEGIKQAKLELEKKRAVENEALKKEFTPELKAIGDNYTLKTKELNSQIENDQEIDSYANSLMKQEFDKYQNLVNQGKMTVEQANAEMQSAEKTKETKAKVVEMVNKKYSKAFEGEFNAYQKQLNEVNSRYNSVYRRQEAARLEQANKKIGEEVNKFKGTYKPSKEILERRESLYGDAYNAVALRYGTARENVGRELGHLRQLQATFSGLGGGIKGYGQFFDNKFLYDVGESMEANNLIEIPESKEFSDWLDADKLIVGSSNIIGRMFPMMGVSTVVGLTTENWGLAARMAAVGVTGWVTEGADMAGTVKGEVLEASGDPVKADKAANSMWRSHIYSMPLYTLSSIPYIGGLSTNIAKKIAPSLFKEAQVGARRTFGQYLKQTGVAAAVSGTAEVLEEIPQEFKQGIDEAAIRNGVEIKTIADQLKVLREGASWKGLKETAVQVIPSTLIMGSSPVFVSESAKQAKNKYYENKVDNYLNGLSINEALSTSPEQYIFNTLSEKGKNFTGTLINTLYTSGNINQQEYDALANKLVGMDNFQSWLKKNKAEGSATQNIVGYKLYGQYQEAKNELDASTEELGRGILEDKVKKAKEEFESYYKGEGTNAVILTMGDGKQFVFSPEEMNFALQFENIRAGIRDKNIAVSVYNKKGQEAIMEGTLNEMNILFQEKPLEETEIEVSDATNTATSQLQKFTSPTEDNYGTINRNDGKGIVTLTKEEYLNELQGKITNLESSIDAIDNEQSKAVVYEQVNELNKEKAEILKREIKPQDEIRNTDNNIRPQVESPQQEINIKPIEVIAGEEQDNADGGVAKVVQGDGQGVEAKKADYTKRIERKLVNASEEKNPVKKALILYDALNSATRVDTGQKENVQQLLNEHLAESGLKVEDIEIGTKYDETNTSLDATIAGEGIENLKVVEVLSPIIRDANGIIVKRAKVIVESSDNKPNLPQEKAVGENVEVVTPKENEALRDVESTAKALEDVAKTTNNDNNDKDIAFHGTPYNYDKFDASKIGTGEGAAKQGRGLYLKRSKVNAPFYANINSEDAPKHLGSGKSQVDKSKISPHIFTVSGISGLNLKKGSFREVSKWANNQQQYEDEGYDGFEADNGDITVFPKSIDKVSIDKKTTLGNFVAENPNFEFREWTIEKGKENKVISEAYHKAKADRSNPELVAAVESLLSKEQTPAKEESPVFDDKNKTKENEVKPIRQLGTGANVYFETDGYRVNDGKDGKTYLIISDENDKSGFPLTNIEFDNVNEAVFVAKKISEIRPDGLTKEYDIDKIVDGFKEEYKEQTQSGIKEQEVKVNTPDKVQEEVELNEGDKVGVRLNLNIRKSTGENILSVHDKSYRGKVLGYSKAMTLKNVKFSVNKNAAEKIATGESDKFSMASVDGEYVKTDKHNTDGIEIYFNPKLNKGFVDKDGSEVSFAEEVSVIGNKTYARGVRYVNNIKKDVKGNKILSAEEWNSLSKEEQDKIKRTITDKVTDNAGNTFSVDYNLAKPLQRIINAGYSTGQSDSGTMSDHPNYRYTATSDIGGYKKGDVIGGGSGAYLTFWKPTATIVAETGRTINSQEQIEKIRKVATSVGFIIEDRDVMQQPSLILRLPFNETGISKAKILEEANKLTDEKYPKLKEKNFLKWLEKRNDEFRPIVEKENGGEKQWTDNEIISKWNELADGLSKTEELQTPKTNINENIEERPLLEKPQTSGNEGEVGQASPKLRTQENAKEEVKALTKEEIQAEEEQDEMLLSGESDKRRRQGKFTKDGITYERQKETEGVEGSQDEVVFAKGVTKKFKYKVIDRSQLQPSHLGGLRNSMHFIPEAQPKRRTDSGSIAAEQTIANNPNLKIAGENTNAYSGAPVVNKRGEVIQGNNRAAGLVKAYKQGTASNYKQDLINNAEKYGMTKEQVEAMGEPVLVRELDVNDTESIELGNYEFNDIETGNVGTINPVKIVSRMTKKIKEALVREAFKGEYGTTNESIRGNFDAIEELLVRYLNVSQYQALRDSNKNPSTKGIEAVNTLLQRLVFDGGDVALSDMFEGLPPSKQNTILKAAVSIISLPTDITLLQEFQNAIVGFSNFVSRGAKSVDAWSKEYDAFTNSSPRDIYTPLELEMIRLLSEKPQSEFSKMFKDYSVLVKGKKAEGMWGEDVAPITKTEAVENIFKIKQDEQQSKESGTGSPKKVSGETPKAQPTPTKQPTTQPEVKAKLIELGLTEEEAETTSRIYDVYVKNKAAKTGRSVEDVYGDIEFKGEGESGLEQVDAYHGSPYSFDRFTTEKIGTGEGVQAFGWGLYFTDLEGIARGYASELANSADVKVDGKTTTTNIENWISSFMRQYVGETPSLQTLKNVSQRLLDYREITQKEFDIIANAKTLEVIPNRNLYKVSLHQGKSSSEYTWLEWDKDLSSVQRDKIITQAKKEGVYDAIINETSKRALREDYDGSFWYGNISNALAVKGTLKNDKAASDFLLRAGIDGIKYPAESIARGTTSDTARGFNYVVFDENAVTIKERSLFQKEKSTAKGRITFTDLKSIMSIFKNGDASTFVHELSHHDLQGYIDEARKGNEQARQSIREVVKSTYPKLSESEINKKLEEVLKIDRTQENVRGTEYEKIQEHYARGFEKWLKDGDKAGFSAEMVALFEKMKEFLTRIYEAIKLSPIEVQVSPQVEQMYKDMFGIEYFGIAEQLEELRNDIQQDNIENVGDVSMDDLLDGLLQRGLQQDPKPKLTVEESLIKMAEIMFKNFETDEINVINDIKAKINGLQTTEERKQEILAYLTPKMEERLKEEVAFANTNLRQLALKIIQSESATDEMKKQARKNAYYEKMDLQKERDKAEKRAGKNITELENDTNKLVKLVSKDNNVGAELVNDLVSTFQRVNAQYESAKARGDKDMIEKTEAMASDLLDALFNQSTTAGKTLAAQKVLKFVIPDMYVKWIEKKVNLRNSETAVKDLKEKLKEALKNMRALEANESWALQVQDKLENKIESLQDVIAQQNQDIERLQKLKAEVEAEEKKPQERATTEPNLNKKGIIEQAKGSEYVNKLKEEMLRRAKERGLMQDINEMPDSLLLTELATEYIIDQIKNGKKVSVQKLYNFLKDVHFSDTKIDDILSTYQSIKESLKGETSVNNFSTQTEIDEYRDKLLQVKELNGKIREKEMSQDQLEILEYEKILARVNKLKKKISDNDLEMKITPKVNSERIFFLKKEEAKLKKELDDLRKEAKVANWSEEEVIRKRIEKDYDLTEKSEIKAIKDKQKEIDRIDIKLANLEEKSEEKRILAEYKARVEEELSKQKISEAAQNVLADNQKVKTPKAPVVLYRPTQGNQITLAEVDKLNKEKGGNVDIDDLRREFRLGYIGAQELMNAYNKILVQRENNKVRKFVDENYGRVVTKKLDDGTIVETREKFTDEEFEALIETPISNNRTLFDVIQIQMDRQATIKAFEKEQKRKEEAIKQAPLSVAKRIIGEAERRNALRTPKEQDAIKKLKEILFKRAVDRFKEKPFKERVEKSIEEKLADFLNEGLLANGKDWDVEIKKEIDSMIDNAKYSDEDKAMMREFISDYLADRTETLLTNAVADDVLKKVLSEGYPTKDGKVDWHTIIKKNYKNQEGARQYLVEKLGERIGSEKLANDVIEALEKRFQKQVSQRKEKYLEAEIRRLEKLKENEKLPQRVNSRIKKLIELDNIGGLDEDIFYSYMAKELGMDALTPEDLTVVKKFITLIQSTPEGEEKNNLMRTLSAFVSMRVSPKAFTIKSMVEFKLSNMLAHPITSLVNATAGFSQPIMMFKRFLTTGDTNYLKIYFDSFNKGVFKAAFQSGYLKSGMNYESAGGDKLATFSNLEEFEKISKYMDSKAAKLINKLFIGGANLRIPYLIPSLKQYGRFNEGVDSIVRTQAEEMRAYRVIQDKIIRDNKKNGTTMTTREVRELAWQKLYPISTKDAIAQAVQEFADSGVVPTDAMVKRRAFEIQQQMRDDDVRELAEKEGLRDTYRTPPKLNADEIEGIFDAINFVFGAITRGFTKPQKGEIGITGKQVAYQAVKANLIPFVNTVMNLLETGSNFVPVYGAAKAALSGVRAGTVKERGGLSQEERREEYARLAKTQITQNLIGTALSMFLLQMLFDSLNEGLGDDEDEYGIYGSKPYGSKKTNDKTTKVPLRNVVHLPWADIPINAFGVLAPYLYFEAAMSDLKRSIKVSEMNTKSLDEVTRTYLFFNKFPELAGLWLSTMMKNMPLAAPRAFGDMIGKATSGEGSATSRVGEFAGSALKMQFLPQSRGLQDAYEAINPTTPEATNFAEGLAKGGGFITQMMFESKSMYDYRGRTIDIKDKHLLTISGFIRRFGDANKSDEIDKFVTKHKLFVNPANSGKETDKYQEAGGSILTHTPYTSEEIYDSYYAINIRFNMALKEEGKNKMEERYKYEDENGKNVKEEYTKYNLEGLENIYNKWYEANKKSGMSEMSAKAYADREVQKAYSEMYNGIEKQYFIEYKEAKVSTPAEYLRLLNVKNPFR